MRGSWITVGTLCLALRGEAGEPDMIAYPAGTFQMGEDDGDADERPVHAVTLPAFSLDRTEVTVEAFAACVKAGRCSAPEPTVNWERIGPRERDFFSRNCNWGQPGRAQHPMNCITLRQAAAYCAFAGKRLPTEEEWERAAAGAKPGGRRYPWGQAAPTPRMVNGCGEECMAVFAGTGAGIVDRAPLYAGKDGWPATAPVGSFPAGRSPEGGLDLAGNVWEWTSSRYCPYSRPGCDDVQHVLRGGAWNVNKAAFLRATYRFRSAPNYRYDLVGARCARDSEPAH